MSLEILIILVVCGIGGIAVLLHVLGMSQGREFDSAEAARDAWLREFPEMPPDFVELSDDARAALVRGAQGNGLVWCFGADTVARPLLDFDVLPRQDGLEIRFHDIAAPRARIRLSAQMATRWQEWMTPT